MTREEEFLEMVRPVRRRLDAYFQTCLADAGFPKPYKDIKRMLTDQTINAAYLNSRKENLNGYTVQALIWNKAANEFYNFIHPRKTKRKMAELPLDKAGKDPDPLYVILVREQLQQIKDKVGPDEWNLIEMRADGLTYREIGDNIGEQEATVRNRMHRLKKRLEAESLRFI
jgi:RNA polymerase sigma factor (sigma-70 family)